MSRYKFEPLDLSAVATYPLASRPSKVTAEDFAQPVAEDASMKDFLSSLPDILAVKDLRALARLIRGAKSNTRAIIVGLGGHVIKTGLSPVLIDLMNRGYATAFAMNRSAMIHDFEIALVGATSEDVDATLGSGSFGMVYRAYQPGVGRAVAVKMILPEYANRLEFIRRFESEA